MFALAFDQEDLDGYWADWTTAGYVLLNVMFSSARPRWKSGLPGTRIDRLFLPFVGNLMGIVGFSESNFHRIQSQFFRVVIRRFALINTFI